MATVSFGTFSKRRNSTKQPATLSDQRTVTLKERTSQDRPIFVVTGNNFNYNYCMWDGKYYFIDEIESLRNNEIAVHCVMDPLATYKTEILAGTQYVAYSDQQSSIWLPDTRLPVTKKATVATATIGMNFLFTAGGFYVVCVVGESGCNTWILDSTGLTAILNRITNWSDDLVNDVLNGNYPWSTSQAAVYDFSTVENGLESLAKMNTLTGFAGNAFSQAPSCIRSCIWVPFFASSFAGNSGNVMLGAFDTQHTAFRCITSPVNGSTTVSIPWQHSDWRRGYCEDVYLYLPLVGLVSLSADNLNQQSSITIEWSATATDGCVAYLVKSGSQIIGTYGGQCAVNYPIGVSQQASAGQIAQTAFEGMHNTVNAGFSAASNINPIGMAGGIADTAMTGIEAAYNTIDMALTRNATCIGGIGGGAGTGLDLHATCYTVAHDTVIAPSAMKDTMGLPTMKPLQLSTCSGFCQCVNAHVDAPATAGELDAIDAMLNSGFYIE